MLRRTFLHVPGVGWQTERDLWRRGIKTWDDVKSLRDARVGRSLRERLEQHISQSVEALRSRDARFFTRLAKFGEAWRLYSEFADRTLFLDVETTGLSPVFDQITVAGLADSAGYQVLVRGQNLERLPELLGGYSVVVTFNGTLFDLHFLKLAFPELALPPIHIDLRWLARRLGYQGGLKEVEAALGIRRSGNAEIRGYEAPILWSRWLRGDQEALQRLIEYNRADVLNLRTVMDRLYQELCQRLWGEAAWVPQAEIAASSSSAIRVPRPSSPLPARSSFERVLRSACRQNVAVVGIDLTASPRRASGWAYLKRDHVITKRLWSDEELIEETLAARPDVVSIDSPLSLPEGYPGARRATIYRKCELALRRMGLPVYWCMLPSMEPLTLRGIRLAKAFRSAGLHVIESYPGAAQDVLGIPRKKVSLEELKLSLRAAGIRGSYCERKVSHDELDAITSALVGVFYLLGEYIALGTPQEGYLILPASDRVNTGLLRGVAASCGLTELGSIRATEPLEDEASGAEAFSMSTGSLGIPGLARRV